MFEGLFQPAHLILILVIVLIVFGPGKLPEIGAALGKGIREFKRSTMEMTEELRDATPESTYPVASQTATSVPTASGTDSKLCPKCSAANPAANKFCGHCGAALL